MRVSNSFRALSAHTQGVSNKSTPRFSSVLINVPSQTITVFNSSSDGPLLNALKHDNPSQVLQLTDENSYLRGYKGFPSLDIVTQWANDKQVDEHIDDIVDILALAVKSLKPGERHLQTEAKHHPGVVTLGEYTPDFARRLTAMLKKRFRVKAQDPPAQTGKVVLEPIPDEFV